MKRAALVFLLVSGCSIEPFEPFLVGEGGVRLDAGGGTDADGIDAARVDASTGGEDCTNGVDDDDDGMIDCADSDCGTFVCVDPAPAGWAGYGTLGDCATSLQTGATRLRADPVTCDASCTCGTPSNLRCSARVFARGTNVCGGTSVLLQPGTVSDCASAGTPFEAIGDRTFSPSASCATTGPMMPNVATRPDPMLTDPVTVCPQDSGGGCEGSQVCVPTLVPRCITREGNVACPADLPHRRQLTLEAADERTCSNCGCGLASGTCTADITAWASASCSAGLAPVAPGMVCADVPTSAAVSVSNPMFSGLACGPTGGAPRGCVGASRVATVCCDASAGPTCPAGTGPPMLHQPAPGGAFCIDSTEVTNAQYQEFLAASPDTSGWDAPCAGESELLPDSWPPAGAAADEPVLGVTYCQAYGYCRWAGKRLCGRLGGGMNRTRNQEEDPTLSEWTWACSAGGTADPDCNADPDGRDTDACCELDGLYRLAGGAEEWVASTCDGGDCLFHERDGCFDVDDADQRNDTGIRCCADPG